MMERCLRMKLKSAANLLKNYCLSGFGMYSGSAYQDEDYLEMTEPDL